MPVINFYRRVKSFYLTFYRDLLVCYFPKIAVKRQYKLCFGVFPDLKDPKTINEKLQVLKLGEYYNNRLVSDCIDKYKVKDLLVNHFKVSGLKIAQLYAVFDNVDELINAGFERYPQKFVIKCNHGSGYNLLCDKRELDTAEIRKCLEKWFKEDYWKIFVEYQYRFIKKKIFIEEYLENIGDTYKFYCFNGHPKFFYVSNPDEHGNADAYCDYFDMNFRHLDILLYGHLHSDRLISKPTCFNRLIEIAEYIAKDFPFVRVDLYVAGNDIYFSELTFIPTGGYMKLEPPKTPSEWGDLLKL